MIHVVRFYVFEHVTFLASPIVTVAAGPEAVNLRRVPLKIERRDFTRENLCQKKGHYDIADAKKLKLIFFGVFLLFTRF